MELDVSSARSKVIWAENHLETVRLFAERAITSDIYRQAARYDRHEGQYVITVEVTDRTVFDMLALAMGDFLNNLRASLDHLANSLVIQAGGTPSERTQFPILDDRLGRRGHVRSVDVVGGDLPSDALTLLERAQPYQRSEAPWLHPLWLLRELVNIDKHRRLNLVAAVFEGASVSLEFPSGALLHQSHIGRAAIEGTPVAYFAVACPPEPHDVRVGVGFTPYMTLGELLPTYREYSVHEILGELLNYVSRLVDCFTFRLS